MINYKIEKFAGGVHYSNEVKKILRSLKNETRFVIYIYLEIIKAFEWHRFLKQY